MNQHIKSFLSAAMFGLAAVTAGAQGTAFNYQGRLNDGTNPANGKYDLTFTVWDSASGGAQAAVAITNANVQVANGIFTSTLDFGATTFNFGAFRWLELGVRTNGSGTFTTLSPRQTINPTPYAIYAEGANASGLIGQVTDANLSATFNSPHAFTHPGSSFTGNGSGLTALNASQLTTGTVADARLSSNVATRTGGNVFGGNQIVSGGSLSISSTNQGAIFSVSNPAGSFSFDGYIGTTGNAHLLGQFTSADTNWPQLRFSRSIGGAFMDIGQNQNGDFTVQGNDADRLVVQAGGNVGIGTTSPGAPLHVLTSGFNPALLEGSSSIGTWLGLQNDSTGGRRWNFISTGASNTEGSGKLLIHDGAAGGGVRMTFDTVGNVGIGTTTPASDAQLQVKGMVRMGSETGTSEAPNRSLMVRRINSNASAAGQVLARNGVMTLERDGTAGGIVVKITANGGFSPVITGTGIAFDGSAVNVYKIIYNGGTAQTVQIFTDAQKIGHFRLSFGDPLDVGDLVEVVLTRAVDNGGNNTIPWVGTMTSTVNQ